MGTLDMGCLGAPRREPRAIDPGLGRVGAPAGRLLSVSHSGTCGHPGHDCSLGSDALIQPVRTRCSPTGRAARDGIGFSAARIRRPVYAGWVSSPRILINAISLSQGGGRSYVRNLLREVNRDSRGFEFVVLTAAGKIESEEASGIELLEVALPREDGLIRTIGRVLYEETMLPQRSRGYDLLYCLADLSPAWGRIPTVAALRNFNIYDRRFYDDARTRVLLRLVRLGVRRARGIVCPTRAAAVAIAPVVGVELDRFSVVHHGIDPEIFSKPQEPVGSDARYMFFPAALERHKNMLRLFEAMPYIDPEIQLWIAGGGGWTRSGRSTSAIGCTRCSSAIGCVSWARCPTRRSGATTAAHRCSCSPQCSRRSVTRCSRR
ncbi:MAG: hypothetical protein CL938_03260 [Deltaproteobacteria bacterium]|nr:hypothetical protein [Deltaproteobacteria bacterium]